MGTDDSFLLTPSQVYVYQNKLKKNEAQQIKKWRKLRNKLLINHLLKKLLKKKLLKNIIKDEKWFRHLRSNRDLQKIYFEKFNPISVEFNNRNEKKKDLTDWWDSLPTIMSIK